MQIADNTVYFEAALRSESGSSMFDPGVELQAETLDEFRPPPGEAARAATALEAQGMRIRHIGTFSISGEVERQRWEEVFGTEVEERSRPISEAHPELGEQAYLSHVADAPFTLPSSLENLVDAVYPQLPPIYFESPLPPRVGYHHLRVPDDVAMVLRATSVHQADVTGRGVLVAMPDTGFYAHPFYDWHRYNYQRMLAPDATHIEDDAVGHGTAEAANIFSVARDIDFVGVKMGGNATLSFKAASDLQPAVMTNSWGYHLPGQETLPNFLKPLEAAVIEAVKERGIAVCFSGGNGHIAFPSMMPEVIAVGGVYAKETLAGDDFDLVASDYASSFESRIYPGRHVPDVCGLVGMRPRAVYIMLPVQPGDDIDSGLGGGAFPDKDETAVDDGWAVISGTSAASPQIAGVCALLKQVQPGLSPSLVKSILMASARDVTVGNSANGQPAGHGRDGATGTGLVDAHVAYTLARSVQVRSIHASPPPL